MPQAGWALTFFIDKKVSKKSRPKKGDCKHRSLSNLHAFSFAQSRNYLGVSRFYSKRRNFDFSFTITGFRPLRQKVNITAIWKRGTLIFSMTF